MRYFDCNCSYGRASRPPHRFAASPRELLDEMALGGINAALVFHTCQRFASPATWNVVVSEDLRDRGRLLPAWAILPEACGELPPPEELIAQMNNRGVAALWAFPQEHRYRLNRASFPELFRIMAQRRIPLFVKEDLVQLKELLEDCPDLPIVAVNQGPHSLERYIRPLMDEFPNLHIDTSYLLVDGVIEELCRRFGPERILFGTAFPDNCSGGALLRLAQTDVDQKARRLIAAENLERLLAWNTVDGTGERPLSGNDGRDDGVSVAAPSEIALEYLVRGRSDGCPIVDLHGHWGPFGGSYLPCASEKAMLHSLRRAGVRRIVCSAHDALFADPQQGNVVMQDAVARNPDILSAYWAINPNYADLAARAQEDLQASRGFIGFKFLPDYHAYPLSGDRYRAALECADGNAQVVLVHTWGGSAYNSPQMLAEVATRYPGATFLMGHSGYGDWAAAVDAARQLPNVFLELTATYAAHDFAMQPGGSGTPASLPSCLQVNGILEYMVDQAGSHKIVFGTDMPWYSPYYAAGAVLFARISDEARHDILHRNAQRILETVLERCRGLANTRTSMVG